MAIGEKMNWITNFLILSTNIIEYLSFFYTIFRKKLRNYSRTRVIYVGGIMLLLACYSFRELKSISLLSIGLIASGFIVYFIFDISIIETIKLYLVTFPTLSILESILEYFFEVEFGIGETEKIIAYMICIIAGLWLYYVVLGRKLDREVFQIPDRVSLIVSGIMFLLVGMISYFTYVLTAVVNVKGKNIGLLLVMTGGFVIFVLSYAIIYYFNIKHKYQLQSDMLEQYNEQQKQYFEELLQKEQSTRQFRHDITSDLLLLQNYCKQDEAHKAEEYINEMLREITVINKKGYNTGNEIINTVLNSYFTPIEKTSDIKVKGFVDNEVKISRRDLCVIVSNLVKNAVEAVEKCSDGNKKIEFEVNQGKQFLYIKVKNTANCKTISIKNNYPVTSKSSKWIHGFGIKNVVAITEKYNGSYMYKIENGYYIAKVYLEI